MGDLREKGFNGGGFPSPPPQGSAVLAVGWVGRLSSQLLLVLSSVTGRALTPATAPPAFHVVIHLHKSRASFLAKVVSAIDVCGEYKKDPLTAALLICFLRSKGC